MAQHLLLSSRYSSLVSHCPFLCLTCASSYLHQLCSLLISVPDSSMCIVRRKGRESCPIDNQLTVSVDPLPIHQLPIKCDSALQGSSNSDKSAADVFHVPSGMVKGLFELLKRNI